MKIKKTLVILILIAIIIFIVATLSIRQILTKNNQIIKKDEETQVKVTAEVTERLFNGFANILITIESNNPIENVTFPNEDGTTLTITTNKLKLAKEFKAELEKEYTVTVKTSDGKVTNEKIKIPISIADIVNVGDFINYSAGNWTEEDINKVGTYYSGSDIPTILEKYGGFKVGQSKDHSINPSTSTNENNIYSEGWRVITKNIDGTINIVHAGTTESYNVPYCGEGGPGSAKRWKIIAILGSNRNWTMYEDSSTDAVNTNYVVVGSAHCITKNEVLSVNQNSTLRAIGVSYNYYYDSSSFPTTGPSLFWIKGINNNGSINAKFQGSTGIRPVVSIKSNVKATANVGDLTHDTLETAWNLSLDE